MADRQRKEQNTIKVPLFSSIRFRLTASFLVPVLCIIILGFVSSQKSSNAILESYQSASENSMSMVGQYMNLAISTLESDFIKYVNDGELSLLYRGEKSGEEASVMRITTETELKNRCTGDDKIKGVYLISKNQQPIYVGTTKMSASAYDDYVATEQGQSVINDKYNWHVLGVDTEADAALGVGSEDYAIRLARNFKDSDAILVLDISRDFVTEALSTIDCGEEGQLAIITEDNREFLVVSEEKQDEVDPEDTVFLGEDFLEDAYGDEAIGTDTVEWKGKQYLFVYSQLETGNNVVVSLVPEDTLLEKSRDITLISIVLTVIAAVIALLLGTMMASRISGTIRYILDKIERVSRGDLTIQLKTKKKDELGMLCVGVNNMVGHVKNLIIHVNGVSGQLNQAANYVADTSKTFMETSEDIQRAVSEIEVGVNRLDSGSEDCLSQMDSLSGKITNVSMNANEIEKLTTSTNTSIGVGINSVQALTSSAESTTVITKNVISAIEELEEKSNSINKIIGAINEIAEQTNLLSLNASIEAARAGEAGKGFAVVAEEIRKLSDQCLESAAKISDIVNEIVLKTGDVVKIAKQAEDVVSSQASAVEETTASFNQIDEQVRSLIVALNTISSNVQEMNSSRTETLGAIESISAVSAETAACSSSVYTTAGTQLSAVGELDRASEDLRQKAEQLIQALSTFQV